MKKPFRRAGALARGRYTIRQRSRVLEKWPRDCEHLVALKLTAR
jgi:hypothetical protein